MHTIPELQEFIGTTPDGVWGPKSQAALLVILGSGTATRAAVAGPWHKVKASSFADPADVAAFLDCKALGGSDDTCFETGDNGIGKWGHNTAQEIAPMAALPGDIWTAAGKKGGALLEVKYRDVIVSGILGDTLPSTEHIHNGAGIDLNPAFAKRFGLKPPFMADVEWRWV